MDARHDKPSRGSRRPAIASGRATRRWKKLLAGVAAAGLALTAARDAGAQIQSLDLPIPGIAPPPLTGDIEQISKRAFWKAGKQRWFLSSTLEIGNLFVRGGAAVGYGKPHWSWFGLEGSSAVSVNGGVGYGGAHLQTPYVDLRVGARYTFASGRHLLAPRDFYIREHLDYTTGPHVHYVNMEAEVASQYRLFGGAVFGIFGLYRVIGTPPDWYVFEQTLQVVAKPKLLWRARAGYLAKIDRWDMFRMGAAVEVIGNPPRGSVVVRAGPGITTQITHHLEAYGQALLVVYSPDKLGIASGQIGELGFRYRWATGDRWPEFP